MSKKVDLNAPRNSQNDYKKSHNNHSFSHGNMNATPSSDETNAGGGKDKKDELTQKATEIGLQAVGVPKFAAKAAGKIATNDKVKALVKFPMKARVVLPIVMMVAAPIMFVVLFLLLFSDGDGGSASDFIALAETCSKITITDTGCDASGNNCTHEYDGEVDFDDYIAGVVAGLGDGASNKEFYKAMAVMTRTYFLANASSDCQVSGNSSFMEYKDISVADDKNMIKDAVSDTSKIVLIDDDDELKDVSYGLACVVNKDDKDYYVRYKDTEYQLVATSFDTTGVYRGKLNSLYSTVDKSNEKYDERSCPSDNESNGLSLIGALYLAKNDNYDYQKILNYYFGEVKEVKAEGTFDGNVVDGFINPVKNFPKCTSSFGCRVHPITGKYRSHGGIDIPVVVGTPVYATKSGRVSAVRTDVTGYLAGSYGNYVDIDHMDGTKTRYAHLKYGGVMVSVGTTVNQGQAIALSGNTGGSTGPHLHYEVHVNGVPVDPYNYLDTSAIGDAGSCNYGRSVDASYCKR